MTHKLFVLDHDPAFAAALYRDEDIAPALELLRRLVGDYDTNYWGSPQADAPVWYDRNSTEQRQYLWSLQTALKGEIVIRNYSGFAEPGWDYEEGDFYDSYFPADSNFIADQRYLYTFIHV